jgi:hypothetical protein
MMDATAMRDLKLTTIGAWCGILTTASFVVGIALMAASGVQVLIPETGGHKTIDWIDDVNGASGAFFAGAWFVILGGFFAFLAIVGFYFALRDAGPVMLLAPVLGGIGMGLVQISHMIPIAIGYRLAPDYADATGATQASLGSTAGMFASLAHVLNYSGDALVWGVVVPLLAWAILATRVVARWIGWLGLVTGVFAGWLGLLSPASSLIDGLTFIGFVGFFVFNAALGVALLRRRPSRDELAPVSAV